MHKIKLIDESFKLDFFLASLLQLMVHRSVDKKIQPCACCFNKGFISSHFIDSSASSTDNFCDIIEGGDNLLKYGSHEHM